MKELSIEEKAKRYDEAIEKLRSLHEDYDTVSTLIDIKKELENILPELKESEDERIFEEIYKDLHTYYMIQRDKFVLTGIKEIWDDKWFKAKAWFEKQGKKKSIDNLSQQEAMDIAVAKCFNEQKPADKVKPKFKVGDKIQYSKGCGTIMTIEKIENGEYIFGNNMGHTTIESGNKWHLVNIVEQKPAWSEEDKEMSRFIGNAITADGASEYLESKAIQVIDAHVWLDGLKDRVQPQPKQEWTMQDEEELQIALDTLVKAGQHSSAKWLKNVCLVPQSQWKPSDEQMAELRKYSDNSILRNLYYNLKKLKI